MALDLNAQLARHGISLRDLTPFEGGASGGAYSAIDAAGERVVLKLSHDPEALTKANWGIEHLPRLRERGYPLVLTKLAGALDDGRVFIVQEFASGEPPKELDESLLQELFALNELQSEAGVVAENRDWSWWIDHVLFGDDRRWQKASSRSSASASLCRRLKTLVSGTENNRLPVADFVHGDFGPHNVVMAGGKVAAVVDWDNFGIGTRAQDLAELLVAWQLLQEKGRPVPPEGADRLLEKIESIAGSMGRKQLVTHALLAGLAFWAEKGSDEYFASWVRTGNLLVARL